MELSWSEVRIRATNDEGSEVELWYVRGLPNYFPTKIVAEKAARLQFPYENWYSRVYFARFVKEGYE